MTTRRQASLDDDLSAPAPARKGPRGAHAVIVGINEYEDARIRNLSFARRDAEVLAEILRDPSLGRFPEGNVSLLLDGDATRRNIVSAIGTQLRRAASPDDLVCVFFAGHGATDPDPGARSNDGLAKYLLPHDADLDDLFSSALPMQDVERFFNRIAARQIVFFLDACYSGGADTFATRSVLTTDFLEKLAGGGEGRLVLTSCRPNEVSLEDAAFGGGHGLYSHYLLRGLQGEADTDGDGFVSLDELYDYLQRNVSDHARRIGGSMSPIRTGSVQGEIFLTSYTTVAQREGDALAEEGARLIVSDNLGEATAVLQRALELVPGHVAAMAALATVDATLRRRRRVLVELNREGRLSDAVLDDALKGYEADITKLQKKLSEARARQSSVVNRLESAENRYRLREMTNGDRVQDAFSRFETLERRVDEAEGRADALGLGYKKSLDEEIAELQAADKVADELAALKAAQGKN